MSSVSAVRVWFQPHSSSTRRICAFSISSSDLGTPLGVARVRLEDEILFANLRLLRDDHGTLDGIFQFTDVPGPGLLLKKVHRSGVDAVDFLVHLQRELADEMIDQQRNVIVTVTQRR